MKKQQGVAINELIALSQLKIKQIFNSTWTHNLVLHPRPQRPGLALTGYFKYMSNMRLQILGKTEIGFLNNLKDIEKTRILKNYFSQRLPGVIISESQIPHSQIVDVAKSYRCPILVSELRTSLLLSRISGFLYQYFSKKIKVYGVLMDIMGQGVMLTGSPGIGKSETALELINKGYHLIADDIIEFYLNTNDDPIGRSSSKTKYLMEVRGLGIINVCDIFGSSAVLDEKKLDLVIDLEKWDPKKKYDRLGETNLYYKVLGIDIPMINIPVGPGRNVSTLIEVTVRYFIARKNGIKSFLEVHDSLLKAEHDTGPEIDPA